MKHRVRIRFLAQIALAIAAGASFVLTLVWRDWIEVMLRISPDEHDGSLEFVVSSVLLTATVALAVSARAEWRRHAGLASGVPT
jgi:hypothetical protein